MSIFDQLFPADLSVFNTPVSDLRITIPGQPLSQWQPPQPIKKWNRAHSGHWCPQCRMNTRGAKVFVDLGSKHCGHCGTLLFTAHDSPPQWLPADYQWFMRLSNGPRGTGWYRRKSIEILFPVDWS